MYIDDVITEVHKALGELGIEHEVIGRSKHFYSIYKKMKYQDKQIDEIFDLNAVRILVNTVKDCYAALGSVHTLWKPLPGRFKDYIAMPKPNLYQSLHTTVLGKSGNPFEIQIRTWEMHHVAEFGIAAHWKYKEGVTKDQEDVKLAWLRQTLEWNQDMNDPREFMETLKMDLFSNQVFVFTPKGDVMELPAGSTPLDFAFKIHTDVGVKCIGAKVDAKMVPIDYELQNGEIVDIVTQNNAKGPSIDWLQIAKSSNAKSKIRQWLKKQDRSNSIDKGRELLEKAIRRKGWNPQEYNRNAWILKIAKQMGFKTSDELYTSIANGGIVVSKVLVQLEMLYNHEIQHLDEPADTDTQIKNIKDKLPKSHSRSDGVGRVKVQGINNLLIRLARCCSPVPGDEIIGYITKGRGVTVHRKDCTNIVNMHSEEDLARLMTVDWETGASGDSFDADIIVVAEDRKGLFSDVSRKCTDLDVNITGVNSRTEADKTVVMQLTLQINSIAHLQRVIRNIRRVESVTDVSRARGN
jgi:GTP pyrophosphokinase